MENTKVITYIGKERCDIIYYLIKVAARLGKKILVVDNSGIQDLSGVYGLSGNEDKMRKKNVTVCRQYIISEEWRESTVNEFDFIFVYEGLKLQQVKVESDLLLIGCSFEKREIEIIKNMIGQNSDRKREILILRDKTSARFSVRTVMEMLDMPPKKTENYVLEFDEFGYGGYVALTQSGDNEKIALRATAGKDTYDMIQELASELYAITNRKDVKKYLA